MLLSSGKRGGILRKNWRQCPVTGKDVIESYRKTVFPHLFSFACCIKRSDIKEVDALFECILNSLKGCFLVWCLHDQSQNLPCPL